MKYSLCSISFRHELVCFDDLVHFASRLGFAGIELWGVHASALLRNQANEASRILDSLETNRLCISMISDYIDIDVDEIRQQAMLDRWGKLISLAQSFRTDKLRIFAGSLPSARAASKNWAQCISSLQMLVQIASENGIYVAIETHPNTLADTLSSTLRLIHEVDHPHLRVNLDFLHIWESGSDPLHAYRELKEWTVNYHLKNIAVPDKLAVFAPGNVYSPYGDRQGLTTLSEGAVDYSSIISQLNRDDCAGMAAIEWFGDQALQYLTKEMAWLRASEHEEALKY